MAMTDRHTTSVSTEPSSSGERRGFRPGSRRRARIAAGAALAAVAIGGNVLIYSGLDDKTEVLQVVNNIRAGELVTSADLRVVEADLDASVTAVEADQIGLVLNQYARVYITSGSLMVPQLVQPTPLVSAGAGVVAIEIRPSRVPSGLRERSRVMIVVVSENSDQETFVTTGRVVDSGVGTDNVSGLLGLSVEVSEADAARVAAGNDVRLVVLDPAGDAARELGG